MISTRGRLGGVAALLALTLILGAGLPPAGRAGRSPASSQGPAAVSFDEFFLDKALRVELYQVGNAAEELVTIDRVVEEPVWPETRAHLVEPFENGRYAVKVRDAASGGLIYSRGFDGMFGEYKTTTPAIDGAKRVFQRPVRIPRPRRPALFAIEVRDKSNVLRPLFEATIDPADYHIIRETPATGDLVYEARKTGDPRERVDLVFVGEGYTSEQAAKFQADVDRFSGWLFEVEPYASRAASFNLTGILRPSPEDAMDEPRQGRFRKTALDASFNALDLDRYMLIEEERRLREIAAQVPYDAIVVLVNSSRYGGGGIYNDYCVTTVDHARSREVFIHELGHSFAGLADEYYASEVSYNEFYPPGIEPLEPNITALLDPANVKWKALLSPGIAIPTPHGKEEIEVLEAERRAGREAAAREVEKAKAGGRSAAEIEKLQAGPRAADAAIVDKIKAVRARFRHLEDKVGVFEGAGYASKGLYRPQMYCLMISNPKGEFCRVCQAAISRMIDYYAGGN